MSMDLDAVREMDDGEGWEAESCGITVTVDNGVEVELRFTNERTGERSTVGEEKTRVLTELGRNTCRSRWRIKFSNGKPSVDMNNDETIFHYKDQLAECERLETIYI